MTLVTNLLIYESFVGQKKTYLQVKYGEIKCILSYTNENHCRIMNIENMFIERTNEVVLNIDTRVYAQKRIRIIVA